MANKLILKNGAGVPAPEKLEVAELALDTEDGSLYSKLNDGSVVLLNDGADDVDLSDYIKEAPEDGKQYARQDAAWAEIQAAISLDDYYTKTESDDAFQPKGDYLTEFVEEDPTVPDHVKGITQDDIDGWNAGGSGSGNGNPVVISDNPPASPEEGDLWYSSKADDEGLYCWDGEVWFEAGGANGADGEDGKQIWSETTPDGDIFYDKGNVSVSGTVTANTLATNRGTNGYFFKAEYGSTGSFSSFNHNGGNQLEIVPLGGLLKVGGDGQFDGTISSSYGSAGNTSITSQMIKVADGTGVGNSGGALMTLRSRNLYSDWFGISMGSSMAIIPIDNTGSNSSSTGTINIGSNGTRFKDGWFTGTVNSNTLRAQRVIQDGAPVIDAKGLISTLATLRNATKDETTLEGLRDSIGNAIGGLIEKYEAEIAVTMEISE